MSRWCAKLYNCLNRSATESILGNGQGFFRDFSHSEVRFLSLQITGPTANAFDMAVLMGAVQYQGRGVTCGSVVDGIYLSSNPCEVFYLTVGGFKHCGESGKHAI